MANETTCPTFTTEQKEAWKTAKLLLKSLIKTDVPRYRALHIAMSMLRGRYRTHKGPIEAISKNPDKIAQKQSLDYYNSIPERVDAWIKYFDNPGEKKLYIIVDDSLSDSQKAVQSAHAAALFQKEHPLAPWANGTLILLTIDRSDKRSMDLDLLWDRYHYRFGYRTRWCESDLDNKLTAIVLFDDYTDINRYVRGVKLL